MSDEQRLLELIHADLDGRLDRAGKAELAQRLLADPAARRLQDQLRQTDMLLKDIPQAAPPEGLRSAILEAAALSDHDRGGRREADGGVGFRLAAAVVAGLVVVGLGYGLLSERRDMADLQGSVVAGVAASARLGMGAGEVVTRVTGGDSSQRLVLESSGAASGSIFVRFDPQRITCSSVGSQDGLSSPMPGQWVLAVTGETTRAALDCTGAGTVQLESRSDGKVLDTATIALEP
jgi:hypothetical protein